MKANGARKHYDDDYDGQIIDCDDRGGYHLSSSSKFTTTIITRFATKSRFISNRRSRKKLKNKLERKTKFIDIEMCQQRELS